MQNVNIYIGVSVKGPRRASGVYIYILECMKGGETVTRKGRGRLEDASENQLTLTALAEALGRLRTSCVLTVHTSCAYVIRALEDDWTERWKENGWLTSRCQSVKNAELWQRVLEGLEPHDCCFSSEPHSYSGWMAEELKKDVKH